MNNHKDSHSNAHELGHVVPASVFIKIFAALVLLTLVTVAISLVDMGPMNIVVAMLVASCKAALVALFFMHLKYEHPMVWMYAIIPLVILALLLGGVFIDNPFRWY